MIKPKRCATFAVDFLRLFSALGLTLFVKNAVSNEPFPTLPDYTGLLPLHASALARNPVSGLDLWWDTQKAYGLAWQGHSGRLAMATEENHVPHLWQYAQGLNWGEGVWFGWTLENETRSSWRNGLRFGIDAEMAMGTRFRLGGRARPKSWNENRLNYDFSLALRPIPDGYGLSSSWLGVQWPWTSNKTILPTFLASVQWHQRLHLNLAYDFEGDQISLAMSSALGSHFWAGVSQWPTKRPLVHVHTRTPAFRHHLLPQGQWWEMKWDKPWVEGEGETDWLGAAKSVGFEQVKATFDAAEKENDVRGLYITLRGWRANMAMATEVAGRLDRLRHQGKKVVVYADHVTPLGMLLGAHADQFIVHPQGYFGLHGLSVDLTFYRGLMEKVGLQPEFIRHGRYKAFDEPFMRQTPSEEYRFNTQEWLGDLWQAYLKSVAQGGRRDTARLQSLVAQGALSLDSAKAYGQVDTLLNEWAAKNLVQSHTRGWEWKSRQWDAPMPQDPTFGELPSIGLLNLSGPISDDGQSMWPMMSERGFSPRPTLAKLRALAKDDNVRAVVIRMDSPGGSALASDIIAEAIDSLRATGKPVVLSVGAMAASGGYYLATACDKIVAEPSSMVGSIGVVWGKVSADSLSRRLGVHHTTIKTSEHADAQSMFRPFNPEEETTIQNYLDAFYQTFTARVAKARGFDSARLDSVCEGRVFMGQRALANGMVDTLGGLETALQLARDLAKLKGEQHEGWDLLSVNPNEESLSLSVAAALSGKGLSSSTTVEKQIEPWLKSFSQWRTPKMWAISPISLWQGKPLVD